MKINDQGFTERLSPQTTRTGSTDNSQSAGGSTSSKSSLSSDTLQLSNLAARLQNTSSSDASRSERLSQIAYAVQTNSFQVNAAQISGAMVSEAIQAAGR